MKLKMLPNKCIATFLAQEPPKGIRMSRNRMLKVNNVWAVSQVIGISP